MHSHSLIAEMLPTSNLNTLFYRLERTIIKPCYTYSLHEPLIGYSFLLWRINVLVLVDITNVQTAMSYLELR